ncbi:MAG: polyketide cyclase [Deltaproteobacteria bacterium]|nr:polyketide cyclase [Deltaproteobacteria bacterium]
MTDRSVTHETFVIERTYLAAPARVFAAWADPLAKAEWFGSPEERGIAPASFEFRVGGQERHSGEAPNGQSYSYDATYADIVPDQRIVYTYEMGLDGTRISVSVATIAFIPVGNGTCLTLTEQGAFLDGLDTSAQREQGTAWLLDQLGAFLSRAPVTG